MKDKYQKTVYACFVGYIVQAIVNNFVPLLFLTFEKSYHIPLSQITMLITFNFGIQLLIDLLSAKFVDRIGYRISIVLAHVFSAAGLICLVILPDLLPNAFAGLFISVVIYAVGGGLIEVLISPIVESCPSDNKEKAMSLLHSFYCWGHVAVVLLSTIFFRIFGIENWKIMALIWAIVPIVNGITFTKVPIATLIEEGETGMTIRELCRNKTFWILMLMMLCAGASEQGVSQWASTFAEQGLGVTKTIGDLAGPMAFAILMGSSRAFYGKFGDRMDLDKFMIGSSILHYFLSLHFPCTICICVTDRLFHLWIFRGNHVAGKLQQGIHGTAKRRYIPVCASCTGRRCRMLRRSDFSWICVRDIIRQPEKRNPGRGYFPCIFAGGNSAFGKEPECRVK